LGDDDPEARIDNNWHSPAAALAEAIMERMHAAGEYQLLHLIDLAETGGIATGGSPSPDGEIGLIEGRNLRANYVIPLFTKFGAKPMDLIAGGLLIGKDGEPGTAALITEPLLEFCGALTLGGHVYRVRLKAHFRPLAPFLSTFLNSRAGQAVVRKRIAGGTTPTIRSSDLNTVPVIVPIDRQCPPDIEQSVAETQNRIIEAMQNLGPSTALAQRTGLQRIDVRLPTNWAGGGAQRSSRILS